MSGEWWHQHKLGPECKTVRAHLPRSNLPTSDPPTLTMHSPSSTMYRQSPTSPSVTMASRCLNLAIDETVILLTSPPSLLKRLLKGEWGAAE